MNIYNLIDVEADQLFEIQERTRLIQFYISNLKRQMEQGVFMCIETDEETALYYSNNELVELAEGLKLLMEKMIAFLKLYQVLT